VAEDGMTCGNPCPVMDQSNGTIWLPFCKNLRYNGHPSDRLILEGKDPRTVWITKSTDDGVTWAKPEEISQDVKDPSWTWYATGPGHGIQLKNGSMVIPCNHIVGKNLNVDKPDLCHSHIIYSEDHGVSWKIGGIVDEGTNESIVVQTIDGSLYINCRNAKYPEGCKGEIRRAYAWSQDNGITFSKLERDETLIEPICQASLVRFTDKVHYEKNRVLFSNPVSGGLAGGTSGKGHKREKLTVRISYDECQTWAENPRVGDAVSKMINEGPSAYSDLTVLPDMSICCLYERGKKFYSEKLTLARFNLQWLSDGADKLQPKTRLEEPNSQTN